MASFFFIPFSVSLVSVFSFHALWGSPLLNPQCLSSFCLSISTHPHSHTHPVLNRNYNFKKILNWPSWLILFTITMRNMVPIQEPVEMLDCTFLSVIAYGSFDGLCSIRGALSCTFNKQHIYILQW